VLVSDATRTTTRRKTFASGLPSVADHLGADADLCARCSPERPNQACRGREDFHLQFFVGGQCVEAGGERRQVHFFLDSVEYQEEEEEDEEKFLFRTSPCTLEEHRMSLTRQWQVLTTMDGTDYEVSSSSKSFNGEQCFVPIFASALRCQ
jgi:hypothetical protein